MIEAERILGRANAEEEDAEEDANNVSTGVTNLNEAIEQESDSDQDMEL